MIAAVQQHLDILIAHGSDVYGTKTTPLLLATLDPHTRRYPEDDTRPPGVRQRAYRLIHAPRGSSVYWDQPTFTAMYCLSEFTGNAAYAHAADAALSYFMEHCRADNGVFYWGNHYYYDVFRDENVQFSGSFDPNKLKAVPVNPEAAPLLHEMRPIAPNWQEMYRLNPQVVDRHIRQMSKDHLFDEEQGAFNRHSDRKSGCAFLEAGGILVHALSFLASKTGERTLIERALRIAAYSYGHRHSDSGLLVNNPGAERWDGRMSTTEVGHWAHMLLQSAQFVRAVDIPAADQLRQLGESALKAWLIHGYDSTGGNYYGKLSVRGEPEMERETIYQPGNYSNVWEFLFPSHDYPMAMAMASLQLADSDPVFGEAAARWADIVCRAAESEIAETRYAEQYARNIVYLLKYYARAGETRALTSARTLARQALDLFSANGMLVGHSGARWYDAVDGVGWLLMALMYAETMEEQWAAAF